MLTKFVKFPKSKCPDIWIRLPRHKWPKSWSSMEDPVVPLERNLDGHPLAGLLWEKQFGKILLKHGWEKIPNWECLFVHHQKRVVLICVCGWHKIGWKETKHWSDLKNYSTKNSIWENQHLSGSWKLGLHSKTMWNKLRCPTIWKVMQRNVWSDIVSWQTRRLSNSTKYLLHASMTTTSKKKKQNLLDNCHMYALKLFWNACSWQGLDDLIFWLRPTLANPILANPFLAIVFGQPILANPFLAKIRG